MSKYNHNLIIFLSNCNNHFHTDDLVTISVSVDFSPTKYDGIDIVMYPYGMKQVYLVDCIWFFEHEHGLLSLKAPSFIIIESKIHRTTEWFVL